MPRQMRLTPDHVAQVPPHTGPSGRMAGRSDRPSDQDYADLAARLLSGAPALGGVWIFAYGSLIWNPEFAFSDERLATVQGWHRSFCLGWVRLYRGTPERPGIMLALDRGGSCRGVVFRLPDAALTENLIILLRREHPIKRDPWVPSVRWVAVRNAGGVSRAIAFPISRSSDAFLPDLTESVVVEALATAAGELGSMAEYLFNTVTHLRERGIHDGYLWRMQDLVARRIEAIAAGP